MEYELVFSIFILAKIGIFTNANKNMHICWKDHSFCTTKSSGFKPIAMRVAFSWAVLLNIITL